MSRGSGLLSTWNSTMRSSGVDDLLDQREVVEVRPVGADLAVAEVGDRGAGQRDPPSRRFQDCIRPRGRADRCDRPRSPIRRTPCCRPRRVRGPGSPTFENAVSRRAASAAIAGNPDTLAYGDHPTTSSVKRVPRSADEPPTSASSASNSTSLRDLLTCCHLQSCDQFERGSRQSRVRSDPEGLGLRRRELLVGQRARGVQLLRGARSGRSGLPEAARTRPGPRVSSAGGAAS